PSIDSMNLLPRRQPSKETRSFCAAKSICFASATERERRNSSPYATYSSACFLGVTKHRGKPGRQIAALVVFGDFVDWQMKLEVAFVQVEIEHSSGEHALTKSCARGFVELFQDASSSIGRFSKRQ